MWKHSQCRNTMAPKEIPDMQTYKVGVVADLLIIEEWVIVIRGGLWSEKKDLYECRKSSVNPDSCFYTVCGGFRDLVDQLKAWVALIGLNTSFGIKLLSVWNLACSPQVPLGFLDVLLKSLRIDMAIRNV